MNRTFAHLLSIVFHPMLLPTWLLVIMMAVKPFAFGIHGFGDLRAFPVILMVFFSTFLIPGAGIMLLKPLGFIDSFQLETQKERHAPYIITAIFYCWILKNLMSKGLLPPLFTAFLMGATIGLFLAFFANIFFKISAHGVGMGGFVAALVLLIFHWGIGPIDVPIGEWSMLLSLNLLLFAAVILAGLVGVARLALNAHEPGQLWSGYLAGAAAMWLGVQLLS